jgi:hypothetical protein
MDTDINNTNSWQLERFCVDGVCHCDWRLTIVGCVESDALRIIHLVNIGLSAFAVVLGTKFRKMKLSTFNGYVYTDLTIIFYNCF